ncbi:sensor histidine kinase [Pseudomonas sp. NPDC088368]|uniref:sensor histidine kinase n=1 Tax=Pseudomonas sp. NPDC088368 TaxID=3364453 RepID=UPI0037FC6864
MPEKRSPQRASYASAGADQPWSDYYDMSLPPGQTESMYRLMPDPHSGIAITPLPTPYPAQHLGTLELWAPHVPTSSHNAIRKPAPAISPQDDFSRNAHLQVMGELTVSIAHEICQPLLAIASNASACVRWLQRDNPNLDEAIDGLSDIRKDCERAANIVAALRALARQSPCTPQPVNVNDLIHKAARLHAPALTRAGVTLNTELMANQSVIADPVQVQQLLYNLIANALEAVAESRPSKGVIKVSSASLRDGVQVSVEDNGPGIPVQDRQQIFSAFYTTKPSGLGMGLTICRSVAEAHNGNLYAETSELGGAMIRFQLPLGCKNH